MLDKNVGNAHIKGFAGGMAVEVGALDGKHNSNTRFFFEEWGWHGLMYEPNPASFVKLARNVRDLRVEAYNKAVGPRPGRAKLIVHPDPGRSSISDEGTVDVEVLGIKNVLDHDKDNRVTLLSIDAEGMDTEIVDEMVRHWNSDRLPYYVIVETNGCDALQAQFRAMLWAGYSLIAMTGKLTHGRPKSNTIWWLERA